MWWLLLWACTDVPQQAPTPAVSTPSAVLPIPAAKTPNAAQSIPVPVDSTPDIKRVEGRLTQLVHDHTRDPNNPWAIGHGLVAAGKDMKLDNGASAVEWLFKQYAVRVQVSGQWFLRFPEARGSTRIEPHPDLLLKALTDAGIAPEYPVMVDGHPHVVRDLYPGVLSETFFDSTTGNSSFSSANELPWSLFGIASWSPPGLRWTTPGGRTTSLDAFTDHAGQQLTAATQFIEEAQSSGVAFQKRRQGIFAFTCGGAHLIQGVIHARMLGFGTQPPEGPFKKQLDLLAYRFPIELAQIDSGLISHPEFKVQLLIQRLKLTGHTLETMARVAASGHPDAPTATQLSAYAEQLALSVQSLDQAGIFENIEQIRQESGQLYLDIVGDSAHALRGLRLATGEGTISY